MSITAVSLAPHIEQFDRSGYKRVFSGLTGGVGGDPLVGAKLARPDGPISASAPFRATSARNDRGTNATIPVARTCSTKLQVGQVAFVYRSAGPVGSDGKEHCLVPSKGLGGLVHVISLEQLNDTLSLPENAVTTPSADAKELFVKKGRARSIYLIKDAKTVTPSPISFATFNASIVDYSHPINQYALDGIVCSEADGDEHENDGYHTARPLETKPVCNVGVQGPVPLNTLHIPSINEASYAAVSGPGESQRRPAAHVFVEPARVLSEVYVVLVATRIAPTSTTWTLQYNIVSSSNTDLDVKAAPKDMRVFRRGLHEARMEYLSDALRLVLTVHKLGKVTDCKFGPASAHQFVVCVKTSKYERTVYAPQSAATQLPNDATQQIKATLVMPIQVYRSFIPRGRHTAGLFAETRAKLGGALVTKRSPFGGMSVSTGMLTGNAASKDDIANLKALLVARLAQMEADVNEIKQTTNDTNSDTKEVSRAIQEVDSGVKEANKSVERLTDAIDDGRGKAVALQALTDVEKLVEELLPEDTPVSPAVSDFSRRILGALAELRERIDDAGAADESYEAFVQQSLDGES